VIDTSLLLNTLLHMLPVLYAVVFFDYVLVFFTEEPLIRRMARPLLWIAVVVNLIYFLTYTVFFEHIPLATVYQALGAVAFGLAITYLWVESRTNSPYTAPFILGLSLVLQIVHSEFPHFQRGVPEILQSKLFSLHVVFIVLGYSALAVAAVYSVLYLLLYRQMRNKTFGLVFRRMPPLETLDNMNFNALLVGFPFLLLATLLGTLWQFDARLVVSGVALVVYGGAIALRTLQGRRGSRLAYSSLAGFAILLFLTGFHSFG